MYDEQPLTLNFKQKIRMWRQNGPLAKVFIQFFGFDSFTCQAAIFWSKFNFERTGKELGFT